MGIVPHPVQVKGVHMYKGVWVRYADFIYFFPLNILWKWNNLVSLRPNYFIFIGYLKTGGGGRGGGSSEPPDPPPPPGSATGNIVSSVYLLWQRFIHCISCICCPLCVRDKSLPSRHMTSKQRHFKVDATSWRRIDVYATFVDVDLTLFRRYVPAG